MYDAAYLSVYPFFEKAFRDRPLSAVLDSLTGVVSRACMIEFLHDLVTDCGGHGLVDLLFACIGNGSAVVAHKLSDNGSLDGLFIK